MVNYSIRSLVVIGSLASGHKDNGHVRVLASQSATKLKAIHGRHSEISYKAVHGFRLPAIQ